MEIISGVLMKTIKSHYGGKDWKTLPQITILLTLSFMNIQGVQWLSGRVLDSRPRGRWFESHLPHRVVVLEQDTFILA